MPALGEPNHDSWLLLLTAVSVLGMVLLVARWKVHAFIALVLASLFVGLLSGAPPSDLAKAFQDGVGSTLGFIAVVVGLGTMLGKLLAESGGAQVVAERFIAWFGIARLHWAMMFIGFVVGLPVFFAVGLVLLAPILFSLLKETKLPVLYLGIPLVAGLSASHGLVPPHPGPMVAIEKVGADTGLTILYSIIISAPAIILAGPIFGAYIARRIPVGSGVLPPLSSSSAECAARPSFGLTIFTILLPVLLMLNATLARIVVAPGHSYRTWAEFIGSPVVSLTLALIFSYWSFGRKCGFGGAQILKFMDECLGPVAGIFLVVGAGGGFSKVLDVSGVDDAVVGVMKGAALSPCLLAWCIAAVVRVAVGSATVAITLTAALIAPVALSVPGTNRELVVLAMGAGSLILSHLNDGGFWFVREYLGLDVGQTLKSWTVMETILSVVGLVGVLALDAVL